MRLSLLLLIFGVSVNAKAVWTDISPAGDGSGPSLGYALAPSLPSTLYAATTDVDNMGDTPAEYGIWKSTDSGANWAQVSNAAVFTAAGVSVNNASIALGGVRGGVVYNSTNGTTFNPTTIGSNANWTFGFSPATPATVYAGGLTSGLPTNGDLARSTDSGATWTSITIDTDSTPAIRNIAMHPTDVNTVYVGAELSTAGINDGLYKSTDGGTTWNRLAGLGTLTRIDGLAIDPNDPELIYVGTGNLGEVRRSADGGATWTTIHDPFSGGVTLFTSVLGIAVDPDDSRIIYAVGGSGTTLVIVSTDCGQTWSNFTSTGIAGGPPSQIRIDPAANQLYVIENGALGTIYTEAAASGGSGACPTGGTSSSSGGSNNISSGGGGGGGGGSAPWLVAALLVLGCLRNYRLKSE